ncbi:MAG: phage major capsid protein [Acidobacteria bacterium]|nr:phage major capsid protein [Acidobacteriota bacterium]
MSASVRKILERLKAEPPVRTFEVRRAGINTETRTVSLAFASDKTIDHWFGKLRLSMRSKAIRTERLRSGAPLLMDHNPRDQVGVIEKFSVGGDGIARADVRFGESQRAQEIFRDVQTGIRKNISVGFLVHKLELEDKEKEIYRSDDWEPYEISIVAIPADISVGVGRSYGVKKMSDFNDEFEGGSPELAQVREVREWGEAFGEEAAARAYLRAAGDKANKAGFMAFLRQQQQTALQTVPVLTAAEEAYRQGAPRYELARSVPRYGKLQAFKGEGAEEKAYRFGQFLLAGPMGNHAARNYCQQHGIFLTRAGQTEGINEKGGYLVPEEFGLDIAELIERYGVFRQHAHIVPMASDRRTDPLLKDELESQFVGEMEEGDDTDLDFGQIGYTAKKHMILVPMSSEVSEDSAISIGDQIANAAAKAFAKKEDQCGFNGDATSTYGGITGIREALKSIDASPANIAGLQVGSGNAYSELTLTDFEGVVGRLPDYADMGNAKWFVSRRFYFNVMVKLLLASGNGVTATEIEDARNRKFLGYPVVFSQVMPSTEANSQVCAIFGDLSLGARLGDRRMFTTAIDDSILFRKDALLFRATARFDINVAYGVGDTTTAGPIVGLITAGS